MEYWKYSFSSNARKHNAHVEIIANIETDDVLSFDLYFPNFYCFRDYIAMNRSVFELDLWTIHYSNNKKCYRIEINAKRK